MPPSARLKAMMQLPPLTMLRAFEAVGRTGSMRKAAEDISVSHNVVSYHVRNLESWLGVMLVERSARGASLTQAGQEFYAVVSESMASIGLAAGRLRAASSRCTLKVWCMPGLASRWLTPRLSQIEQHLPGVEIIVRPTEGMPDFARDDVDLMIGFVHGESWPDRAVPLLSPRVFPVASPGFLAHHGFPPRIEDLFRYPLIHEDSRDQWSQWFAAMDMHVPPERMSGPLLWNANMCIDAAIAGQGIVLTFAPLVKTLLENGQLVEIFETEVHLGGYFLIAAPDGWSDPRLLSFREWITRSLA